MIINATARYTPRNSAGQFIKLRITPAVVATLTEVTQKVLEDAKAIVPVRTGELRDSGKTAIEERETSVTGHVVFDAAHAGYVEYGTGAAGSASPGSGPYPYTESWPGMAAQPYLRPALDQNRFEIREKLASAIALELQQ